MDTLEGIASRFQKSDEVMHKVVMESDKRSNGMCTSIGKFIDEQSDIRKIVEELARRIDAMRDGTHPRCDATRDGTHPRGVFHLAAAHLMSRISQMSVLPRNWRSGDPKTKVARLTEQLTLHTNQIGLLTPLKERVDLAERQIIKWRYRLPELTMRMTRQWLPRLKCKNSWIASGN